MNVSNTAQIIVSNPVFAKLTENWFEKPVDKIIKRFLFVKKMSYLNVGIILTLIVWLGFNSEQDLTGFIRVFLCLSSIGGIFSLFYECFTFDRFESQFKQLMESLAIDTTNKEYWKRLNDFSFLESRTKEVVKRWHNEYFNECERYGPLSKDAIEAGKRFSKNYSLLKKFKLVEVEIGVYMKDNPRPAIIA